MNKRSFIKAAVGGCAAVSAGSAAIAAAATAHPPAAKSLPLAAWQERVGESFAFDGDGISMTLRLDRVDNYSTSLPQSDARRMEQFSLIFSQPASTAPASAHPALALGTCRLKSLRGRSQGVFLQPAGQMADGAARWHAPVSRFV